MDSRYNHLDHEQKLYQAWEDVNAFNPDAEVNVALRTQSKNSKKDGKAKPFTIIMPPPNANDPLHVGHAMFASLEDILIRYHRMLGDDTLWVPGTDHAGIETQFVFEKKLKKDGKSRFQFDRETLYQMIWNYVQENSDTAVSQLKRIGSSADWSRFKFTLDPDVYQIALDTFGKLNDAGLVYRDMRLVNYCTKCGTAFSELEVNHKEQLDPLYYMKYGEFTIATVRPETKFRDTALAVNPNDPRYKEHLGKTFDIMGLLGPVKMKVISDEGVDPEFGTGIMKVTPAHDAHDFELGKKYDLPVTPIIDFNGRMDFSWFLQQGGNPLATAEQNVKYLERAQLYHGKKVAEARQLMVDHLKEDGLMLKVDEKYTHSVGTCYRCGTIIEPLPLPQFFIKVKPLTEPVLEALDKGEVKVLGAGHDKILRHWLENLKDWNISRQIVWGIRIPVWYSLEENPDLHVSFLNGDKQLISGVINELIKDHSLDEINRGLQTLKAPVAAKFVVSPTPPGAHYLQETDTFDTWFSSAQWPFSTLQSLTQKPAQSSDKSAKSAVDDFTRFYPTTVMETGYDILPFWVMRMLIMGKFATGQLPFSTVYLHGLVRDQKGQKMSKSKGNVINPIDIVEKFGADALRMALVIRSSAGLDKSVGEGDFKAMRNFTNKIWNAARFILTNLEDTEKAADAATPKSGDAEFTKHLDEITAAITQQLNDYKIGLAAETLYNEFWHWFCDVQIEAHKKGELSTTVLVKGLTTFLKLLHPFVPFVTEAVWQELRQKEVGENMPTWLISSPWPTNEVS
jgi:valyl-tRNA synthetase